MPEVVVAADDLGRGHERTAHDRDLVPEGGHGGITTEPLRDLPGDDALRPGALDKGISPYAITAIDDLNPVMIAPVPHLVQAQPRQWQYRI